MSRSGMALVLVLCTLVVLGGFAGVLRALSASAHREGDAVSGHLRAVAVAEVAFAEIATRLAATPWHQRWFALAPEVRQDLAAAGGTYGYVLRDAGPRQADLLVRATFDRAAAVLHWRLTVPEGSLDSAARVVPVYFTFAPDALGARPRDLDPLTAEADRTIREREANRARFEEQRPRLAMGERATRASGRLTPQLALQQASRKAIVRFLRELQEGMEVVSPQPGCALSHAIVRDKVSRARWFFQVPKTVQGKTLHELWRHVDDATLPHDKRAELLLTDIERLTFTSRGEGALQVDLSLAEGESDYALLTTVRLRNIASAEEIW